MTTLMGCYPLWTILEAMNGLQHLHFEAALPGSVAVHVFHPHALTLDWDTRGGHGPSWWPYIMAHFPTPLWTLHGVLQSATSTLL